MNEQPVREIQPVVVPAQYYVWGPIVSTFAAMFPGFFVFVISNMIIRQFEPVVTYGVVVFILAFIACMVLAAVKVFREPGHTVYTIYPDRLEYYEGFSRYFYADGTRYAPLRTRRGVTPASSSRLRNEVSS